MHDSKFMKKLNLPCYHVNSICYLYSIKRALIYVLLIQRMLSAHLRKFRIVASYSGQSFLENRWHGLLLLSYSTFANEPILIGRSAGTKLMSLVFAHDFPHLWESPASPTTSEVSFPSLRTGAGVTGRLYHNAVFAKPLTFVGRETTGGSNGTTVTMFEPPVAPTVPLWRCVSHRWLHWYPYDHMWATSGSSGTSVIMRDPPVVPMVPLWPCASHRWLQYDHAWATSWSNGTSMTMREPQVAPKVTSVIDLMYFTKPIYLSCFTENSVSHYKVQQVNVVQEGYAAYKDTEWAKYTYSVWHSKWRMFLT